MPTLRAEFGAMVRHHRERQGLTQAELAEKINRSVELVGRIERGGAAPSFDTLQGLSLALKTPVRDFFGSGTHAATGAKSDKLGSLMTKLSALNRDELTWIERLIDTALSGVRARN